MTDNLGLNNRVYQILSQNSQKAAVDILGMRISTKYKNKFTEIMITETEPGVAAPLCSRLASLDADHTPRRRAGTKTASLRATQKFNVGDIVK